MKCLLASRDPEVKRPFCVLGGGRISRIYIPKKKVRGGPRADRDKWSYEAPCKWPYKWVTGVMNLVNEVTYTYNWFFGPTLRKGVSFDPKISVSTTKFPLLS